MTSPLLGSEWDGYQAGLSDSPRRLSPGVAVPKPSRKPRIVKQAARRVTAVRANKTASRKKHAELYGVKDKATEPKWPAVKARIYARDGGCCLTCSKAVPKTTPPHHLVKVAAGGTNTDSNLALLCPEHHADADEYRISRQTLRDILTARYGYAYEEAA
jgi:5-methylcytosine-specific restriction endonuclease McrA